MRSTFAPLLVLASFLGVVAAQTALEIFTPPTPPAQCQPTLLTWQGGTPPYIVSVIDTLNPENPIITFNGLTNNSITWEVATAPGTIVLFTVKDNTGASQNSSPLTVGQGSTSCLTSGSSSASSSGSTSVSGTGSKSATSASTTSTSTAVVTTTSTSTLTTPTSTKPVSSPPATSGPASALNSGSSSASVSAPSTTPSGAAAHKGVPAAAAAAALGAVFVALF